MTDLEANYTCELPVGGDVLDNSTVPRMVRSGANLVGDAEGVPWSLPPSALPPWHLGKGENPPLLEALENLPEDVS